MSNSTLLTDYLGRGLASARPTALSIAAGALALYYETDTSTWAFWNGTGWTALPGGLNEIVAGSGLAGGTITTSGTLSLGTIAAGAFLVNAGTVAAAPSAGSFGSGLTLNSGGTLSTSGGGGEWMAGTVNAVGTGLVLAGNTLSATGGTAEWTAGSVAGLAAGLSIESLAPPPDYSGVVTANGHASTATITVSTTAGNEVICIVVGTESGATVSSMTSADLTWTLRASNSPLQIWWAPAAAIVTSEVVTINLSGTDYYGITAFCVSGCSVSAPWDIAGALPLAVSTGSPGGISTTAADTLVVFAIRSTFTSGTPVPSGFTLISYINMDYGTSLAVLAGQQSAALSGASITYAPTGGFATAQHGIVDALAVTAEPYLTPEWQAGAASDLGTGLALSGGTLDISTALRSVPLAFSFSGKPAAGQQIHVALLADVPLNIPATLAGAATYVGTNPASAASFVLSNINSGTVTTLGTIAIGTGGSITLSGSAHTGASGDVLRITAPGTQDAALADVCITIEGKRP
jgi:hypothetical protein